MFQSRDIGFVFHEFLAEVGKLEHIAISIWTIFFNVYKDEYLIGIYQCKQEQVKSSFCSWRTNFLTRVGTDRNKFPIQCSNTVWEMPSFSETFLNFLPVPWSRLGITSGCSFIPYSLTSVTDDVVDCGLTQSVTCCKCSIWVPTWQEAVMCRKR